MTPATSALAISGDLRESHAWARAWKLADRHWLTESTPKVSPADTYLRWLDGGSFLPPHRLLLELEPALPGLYRAMDPRLSLAEAFATVWNRVNPFAPLGLVHVRPREGWTDLWLEAALPSEPGAPDLAALLPACLQVFPRAFGLPDFEEVEAAAPPRPWEPMAVGAVRPSPSPGNPASPQPPGRRERLYRVGFRPSRPTGWNPLSRILRALATGEGGAGIFSDGPVDQAGLLREVPPGTAGGPPAVHRFVYHRADDSLSCDGRHLARQVPARILRRLVRDYVTSGRREFEFRALKRDPEIVTNRKRPNFEVRLRRVEEVVKRMPCGLVLHHPRPGLVELEALGILEYAEEA